MDKILCFVFLEAVNGIKQKGLQFAKEDQTAERSPRSVVHCVACPAVTKCETGKKKKWKRKEK